jgi:hypothetical protein
VVDLATLTFATIREKRGGVGTWLIWEAYVGPLPGIALELPRTTRRPKEERMGRDRGKGGQGSRREGGRMGEHGERIQEEAARNAEEAVRSVEKAADVPKASAAGGRSTPASFVEYGRSPFIGRECKDPGLALEEPGSGVFGGG